ncbi:TetR/AcrR family transcriptional regulator [Gulosibacter sediminis]|uniref:TetR/AcrR family transcriptional regulator n=1 Tax=Gulosibacter sediminis TaxID=1729695 RepID=UPI0024A86607|nr:TetR/AcrR family transcriptional regulator [Gulosibacter sediminis]
MGRTQTFDTTEVVRSARRVFWGHGFENASIVELEQATGLNRSSIYYAFGSKRGLFDAAVESYLDEIIRPRLQPLTGDEVAPNALEQYLVGLRAALLQAGSLPATHGCMLVNTAGSPIGHDEAVAHTIRAYTAELREAMTAGVRAARPEASAATQAALAESCTSHVITAMAIVPISPDDAARALDAARGLVTTE